MKEKHIEPRMVTTCRTCALFLDSGMKEKRMEPQIVATLHGIISLKDDPQWRAYLEAAEHCLTFASSANSPLGIRPPCWIDATVDTFFQHHIPRLIASLRAHNPKISVVFARKFLTVWLTFQAIEDDIEALHIQGMLKRVGRRPQAPGPSTLSRHAHPRLDPDLAQLAYHLSADGYHWKQIARRLQPDIKLTGVDQKALDKIRAKVNRLVYRGRVLAEPPS